MFNKIAHKIKKEMAFLSHKKLYSCPAEKTVTFTFDDFPRSAYSNGIKILEPFGILGTFYASLGLSGKKSGPEYYFSNKDLKSLYKKGHEIGCHTYNHINCFYSNKEQVETNCQKNRLRLQEQFGILPISFSYPFGDFKSSTKSIVEEKYTSARTVKPGINKGQIDLNALKAIPIYERDGKQYCFKWLKKLEQQGGWLIFYTHDVRDHPSKVGCTTELFKEVVKECVNRNFKIATVGEMTRNIV